MPHEIPFHLPETLEDIKHIVDDGTGPSLLSKNNTDALRQSSGQAKQEWMVQLFEKFDYENLSKKEKGLVRTFIQQATGFSRTHATRLMKPCLQEAEKRKKGKGQGVKLLTAARDIVFCRRTLGLGVFALLVMLTYSALNAEPEPLRFLTADVTNTSDNSIVAAVNAVDTTNKISRPLFYQEMALGSPKSPTPKVRTASSTLGGLLVNVERRRLERTLSLLTNAVEKRRAARIVERGILAPQITDTQVTDTLHAAGPSTFDTLGPGREGEVLMIVNGKPQWRSISQRQVQEDSPHGPILSRSNGGRGRGGGGSTNSSAGTPGPAGPAGPTQGLFNTLELTSARADSTELAAGDAGDLPIFNLGYLTVGSGSTSHQFAVSGSSLLNGNVVFGSGVTLQSISYVFPASEGGSGTVLATDGNGNLDWVSGASLAGGVSNDEANDYYVNETGDAMTGSLAIGTASTSTALESGIALEVVGTMSGRSLYVSGTGASPLLFADATRGNVGIGTTNTTDALLTLETGDGVAGQLMLTQGGVAVAQLKGTSNGTPKGAMDLYYNGTKEVSLNTGTTNSWINAGGNFGIGTNAPTEVLEVVGTMSGTGLHISGGTSGTLRADPANLRAVIEDTLRLEHNETTNYFDFAHQSIGIFNVLYNGSELLRLNSSGNLGIGTDSPSQKLDVAGTMSGEQLYVSGTGASPVFYSNGGKVGIGTSLIGNAGLVVTNGNVGIGTASPSQLLHVSGTALIDDIYIGAGTSEITPSGNTSLLTLQGGQDWSGASAIYLYGASHATNAGEISLNPNSTANAYFVGGGNVGIGTSTPSQKLSVAGTMSGEHLYVSGTGASPVLFTNGEKVGVGSTSLGTAAFYVNGNVGIGDNTPEEELEIDGTARISNGISFDGGASANRIFRYNQTDQYLELNTDGHSTLQAYNSLYLQAGGSSDALVINNNGSDTDFRVEGDNDTHAVFLQGSNDYVGIGTDSPSQKLDVAGTMSGEHLYVSGTGASVLLSTNGDNITLGTGTFYKDTERYIHSAGSQNFFAGSQAGNFSLSASQAVGIGYQALDSITSGGANTAVGALAMQTLSTASRNTAMGYRALENSNANDNTAFGNEAGEAITSGSQNVAVGSTALDVLDTGWANTAIGYGALGAVTGYTWGNTALGRQAGDNITSGQYNIIIGYDQNAPFATKNYQLNIGGTIYADMSNDHVGIGGNATGSALTVSGTLLVNPNGTFDSTIDAAETALEVLGTISGSALYISGTTTYDGNVGIGTSTPDQKLEVVGTISGASILSMGNVGIGITNPSADLQIGSTAFDTGAPNRKITMGTYTTNSIEFNHANGWTKNVLTSTLNGGFSFDANGSQTTTLLMTLNDDPVLHLVGASSDRGLYMSPSNFATGVNLVHNSNYSGLNIRTAYAANTFNTFNLLSTATYGTFGTTTNIPLRLKTGGTDRMFIDMNGNVGIGTFSASGAKLEVAGTMSGEQLYISGTGASPVLFTNGGKVGIGASALGDYAFSVNGDASISNVTVASAGKIIRGGDTSHYIQLNGDGSTYVVRPNNFDDQIAFRVYAGASSVMTLYENKSLFYANNSEAMRIEDNGNLGIGTTTPDQKLSVSGTMSGKGLHIYGDPRFYHETNPATYFGFQDVSSDGRQKLVQVDGGTTVNIIQARASSTSCHTFGSASTPGGGCGGIDGAIVISNGAMTTRAHYVGGPVGVGTHKSWWIATPDESIYSNMGGVDMFVDIGTISQEGNTWGGIRPGIRSTAYSHVFRLNGGTGQNNSGVDALTISGSTIETHGTMSGENLQITGTGATPILFTDSTYGYLGIGTTTPTAKLEINGDIQLSDGGDRTITGPINEDIVINSKGNVAGEGILFQINGSTEAAVSVGGNFLVGPSTPTTFASLTSVDVQGSKAGVTLNDVNLGGDGAYFRLVNDNGYFQIIESSNGAGTGDTTAMTIDSDGNIGMGTDAPNQKLSVAGTMSGRSLNISGTGASAGMDALLYAESGYGNVGIGTTLPSLKLHVADGNTGSNSDAVKSILRLENLHGSSGNSYGIGLDFYGKSDGGQIGNFGRIAAMREAGGGGNVDAGLAFFTMTNAALNSEAMRIDNTGNVGIGTTAPEAELDVAGTISGSLITSNGLVSASVGTANPSRLGRGTITDGSLFGYNTGGYGNGYGMFFYRTGVYTTGTDFNINIDNNPLKSFYLSNALGSINLNSTSENGAGADAAGFDFTQTRTDTSGNSEFIRIEPTFSPTSGTANMAFMEFRPVINQTGGANGITRGINFDPTFTSAQNFRAIEFNNALGWGLYQNYAGSGNYLAGNLGIGTNALSNTLEVAGTMSGEHLQITGTGANPILFTNSDGYVGIGNTSPSAALEVTGTIRVTNVNGPALFNEAASTTNPTLIPDLNDVDTGIGATTSNTLSLIVGGTEHLRLNGTQIQAIAAGSETSPSIVRIGDSNNTGLFWAASDVLGITTDGSEAMRIDDTGNVGIGTKAPSQKLDVAGTMSGEHLQITGTGATPILFTNGGKLGIGTTSIGDVTLEIQGQTKITSGGITVGDDNVTRDPGTLFVNGSGNFGLIGGTAGFNFNDDTNSTTQVQINASGDVGVGSTSAEARLQVTGGGLCVGSDANCNTDNDTEGVVYSSSTTMTTYDVAEEYPTRDASLTGAVVVALDPNNGVFVERASNGAKRVLGVVSTQPAVLLGGFNGAQFANEEQVAVALSGRVPVQVTTENGSINIGDHLTVSATSSGAAMKANGGDQTIGYALQDYSGPGTGLGSGNTIQVFVTTGDVQPASIAESGSSLYFSDDVAVEGTITIASNTGSGSTNLLVLTSDVAGDDDPVFRVQADGEVHSDGAYHSTGADYAEWFRTSHQGASPGKLEAGEIVCIDITQENTVQRCQDNADANVMGIVSTNPAFIGNSLGGAEDFGLGVPGHALVGLIGQVPAKVLIEDEFGIRPGDALTAASIPGYARRALPGEPTVGVALEGLEGEEGKEGIVNVLISRRNSSVTVEQVEEEIVNQIAAMEIEDEVQILVANAVAEVDLSDEVEGYVNAMDIDRIVEESIISLASGTGSGLGSGTNLLELTPQLRVIHTVMEEIEEQMVSLRRAQADMEAAQEDIESAQIDMAGLIAQMQSGSNVMVSSPNHDTLTVQDKIAAGSIASNGTIYSNGMVIAQAITTSGNIVADGTISAGNITSNGNIVTEGTLRASTVETTNLSASGTVAITGQLIVNGTAVNPEEYILHSEKAIDIGDITVHNALFVLGEVTFEGLANFINDVMISGKLTVSGALIMSGTLVLNEDQTGFAVVPRHGTGVTVAFENPFVGTPMVTASSNSFEPWRIAQYSETEFTIELADPAPEDITFIWYALSNLDPRTVYGTVNGIEIVEFPVDENGVPLSSSEIWNACIRNQAPLDHAGRPFTCSRYRDGDLWQHPDLIIEFVWDPESKPRLILPEGYRIVAVDRAEEDSPSQASESSEEDEPETSTGSTQTGTGSTKTGTGSTQTHSTGSGSTTGTGSLQQTSSSSESTESSSSSEENSSEASESTSSSESSSSESSSEQSSSTSTSPSTSSSTSSSSEKSSSSSSSESSESSVIESSLSSEASAKEEESSSTSSEKEVIEGEPEDVDSTSSPQVGANLNEENGPPTSLVTEEEATTSLP